MEGEVRKNRTMEQRLRALINAEAKRVGARPDFLTMEQWLETLEYFNYKCAYCGGPFEILEHYLAKAGTTVSNCVPACRRCNVMKDKHGHDLSFYQNENVTRFIQSKGVKIVFHIHKYEALKKDYVILYCEGCGNRLDMPGLPIEDANAYIDQFLSNTGYAYIVSETRESV
jgi:5-methylcytosine-specific restriction endonuclease McrA